MTLINGLLNPLQHSFDLAVQNYGTAITANAERIYRLETANFTSTQFKNGFSAGMTALSNTFPYGWEYLQTYWGNPLALWKRPIGIDSNSVIGFSYVKFPTFTAALMALCERLKQVNNDPQQWGGTDGYAAAVAAITPTYVNA